MRECSTCKKELAETEFWKRFKDKESIHWRCKDCTRQYRFGLRRKTKQKIITHLGGKCAKCGHTSKSGASLSIDHRKPEAKTTKQILQKRWPVVLEELEKGDCWLLCMNCHMELEFERGTYGR